MDHHKLLQTLTTNEKQKERSFDENLRQLIVRVIDMLPQQIQDEFTNFQTNSNGNVRYEYLRILLYVLDSLKTSDLSKSDTLLSVNQNKTVKAAIEIVVCIGILPCLLPGIGAGIYNICPRAKELEDEKLTDLEKYYRLSLAIRHLTNYFDEVSLRLSLLSQLGPILGGLLQLSYAPLMKPCANVTETRSGEFKMTNELYAKLTKDQSEFRVILSSLMEKCPLAMVIKESMVILGMREAPKWIRRSTQAYLVNAIIQPNGILALIDAVCGDTIDLGTHWDKLDTVARLVATSHGPDPEKYYEAVCSQLVNLLMAKNMKHASTIANNCITVLYDHKPDVCMQKIVRVITAPLRIQESRSIDASSRSEKEITDCIENLTKCFISTDAKFKHPPCTLLTEVAIPLFCLYGKARRSVSLLQAKIRELLGNLMKDSFTREDLFSVFLDHEGKSCGYYGEKLSCEFGPTGGLEITGRMDNFDHEIAADSLFELVANDKILGFDLFTYLLGSFLTLGEKKVDILENSEDTIDRIGRQLGGMKLLSKLAATREIQEEQMKNPQPLLTFIKSLFNERTKKERAMEEENGNIEILYIGLMLVKIILTDGEKPKDWTPYNELAKFLIGVRERMQMPEHLSTLVEELLSIIKNQGKSTTRRYQDLSVDDSKRESDFEKALRDLADPLLPVRAHGLIALTKLLEKKDPETVAKKDIVLCFFQENLKDDDSFVYLSAVNGLCALATLFPDSVIETLVQEYIDMPQRRNSGEILPENRVKLGEILVKTTRSLGEMCSVYKTILINGFLCGTRDEDEMVRASSLSCLGEICKVMGFRLGHAITEIIYCIGCIINTDKSPECRRAALLVTTLLIRGLGKDVLTDLGSDLLPLYRALKFLRANDDDQVLRLHAQLALEELDDIVQTLLYSMPKLEKQIFLLP